MCLGSSVGILTCYGLDGPGFKPRCGQEISPRRTCPDRSCDHPATIGAVHLPRGKVAGV